MAHPLSPDLRLYDLHPAFFTDDPPVLHPLVFSADALVILYGTEDLCAEKAVSLGLEGPVVDRLGLFDLSERPFFNQFR